MAATADDKLPEAATRRLAGGAWSSGLSVADFASCLDMGMEPVGYVQGYSVMQWSWFMATGGFGMGLGGFGGGLATSPQRQGQYVEQWRCPHGFVSSEHRMYGANYELTWLEDSWATGWGLATTRMIDEAKELGATGVVGVADDMRPLVGGATIEFRASGTAVVVPDAPRPETPFSTYLSGQRLAKLIEAGFAPVSVVATLSAVRMLGSCITHYQLAGSTVGSWYGPAAGGVSGVGPVDQVNRAEAAARRLARERIRSHLGSDILHGATLERSEHEIGEGDLSIQCTLKGTRARRFKAFDPLPDAAPVVRLV
ncbi:MAG: heavy metal-binding domain-containing protein [Acidimicrobiales bacterium]